MANYKSDFTGHQIDTAVREALEALNFNEKDFEKLGLDEEEYTHAQAENVEFLLKLSVVINSGSITSPQFSWVPASNN